MEAPHDAGPRPGTPHYYARAAGSEMLWVFGLSILHWLAMFHFGAVMPLALGPQFHINHHYSAAQHLTALVLDVLVASPLLIGGILARFGIGVVLLPVTVLYVADTAYVGYLVFLTKSWGGLMDYLAFAVHCYVSYLLWTRWKYYRLALIRENPPVGAVPKGSVPPPVTSSSVAAPVSEAVAPEAPAPASAAPVSVSAPVSEPPPAPSVADSKLDVSILDAGGTHEGCVAQLQHAGYSVTPVPEPPLDEARASAAIDAAADRLQLDRHAEADYPKIVANLPARISTLDHGSVADLLGGAADAVPHPSDPLELVGVYLTDGVGRRVCCLAVGWKQA